MQIGGLSLFQAMADKMRWHQARQNVLAENVANADTPGFVARDLTPFSLEGETSHATLTLAATSPTHIAAASGGAAEFGTDRSLGYETTASGNGVTLEDEMMKVSSNEIDYQTVTALYTRSVRLIKTALGRTA